MDLKIIYGTDTGNTEYVLETYLLNLLSSFDVEAIELVNISTEIW